MAKYIVDEDVLHSIIQKWCAPYGIVKDVIKQCDELVYCEDCDMAEPAVAPFLRTSFIHCEYYRTDMCRKHYCSIGDKADVISNTYERFK